MTKTKQENKDQDKQDMTRELETKSGSQEGSLYQMRRSHVVVCHSGVNPKFLLKNDVKYVFNVLAV